ncbi:MAG: glycine cleavage system aminomethyltransferase GcvT [Candidatus Margulisiibacteriota bacterium]|nr:glycine cleavage system aminomethyltransferase GcvT [Candidatus Margulisiibacteriota bacterium]
MKRTPLYEQHIALGAKMVPFAGWEMPVSYGSIIDEHTTVRTAAGLFDIEHMGLIDIAGKDALALIQKVSTNDAAKLGPFQCEYSILCNEKGGVIDDILVYRLNNGYRIVANASNTDKVLAWLKEQAKPFKAVAIEHNHKLGMISLQGPSSERIAAELTGLFLGGLKKNHCLPWGEIQISRTGYTGGDGFEFFVGHEKVVDLWKKMLGMGVLACGLGARDTLRLEAGLPLYGHEYDDETTPLDVGYGWTVKFDKGDFIGKEALLKEKQKGVKKKLVGLRFEDKVIPRHGCKLFNDQGHEIGVVTSGTFSPTLKEPIALGFVPAETLNTLLVEIRGKKFPVSVGPKSFLKNPL